MRGRLRRPFYGWYIVAAAVGVQALVGGLVYNAFGTYVVLLERDFDWSRTSLSAAFSFARVEDGLLGPLQGALVDRFGPRAVMRVGFVVFGVGFMLFSRIDSLVEFYGAFVFMAIGAALAGFLSVTTAIVSWFDRRRSLAMGLALLGAPLGGLALPFVVAALEHFGWRTVAFASGVIVLLVGQPLASVVRHRPQDYGMLPDGGPGTEGDADQPGRDPGDADDAAYSAREALRTRAFWFISLAHASAVLVVAVVQVHFVAHVNENLGYSLTEAASLLTFMTTMSVLGRVGGGVLGDRLSSRLVVFACMLGHAAALLTLTFATSLWMLIAAAGLHGLAWGARAPVIVAMRAEYFGARSYGTIMGFSSLVVMLGAVLGPLLGGLSYDITGSYEVGFTGLAAVAGLGALFPWLLPAPGGMRRATAEPQRA